MLHGHICRARTELNSVEGELKNIWGTKNILVVQKTQLKMHLMNSDHYLLSPMLPLERQHFLLPTEGQFKKWMANILKLSINLFSFTPQWIKQKSQCFQYCVNLFWFCRGVGRRATRLITIGSSPKQLIFSDLPVFLPCLSEIKGVEKEKLFPTWL